MRFHRAMMSVAVYPSQCPTCRPRAQWIGKHVENIIFWVCRVESGFVQPGLAPAGLPFGFNFAGFVFAQNKPLIIVKAFVKNGSIVFL